MKVVILAGGFGTRLSEETSTKPKPMVEIGGKPILWHIMKGFSKQGYDDFIILTGFKSYVIKEYFLNYFSHNSDIEINLKNNEVKYKNYTCENWKINIIDTGVNTMTGGRILAAKNAIGSKNFILTYGDGLSDVDLSEVYKVHLEQQNIVTLTGVQPTGRFGSLGIEGQKVVSFMEKNRGDGNWVNGGFFVCSSKVFDFIENSNTVFEEYTLPIIAKSQKLGVFQHHGYWQCMDTLRDKLALESEWKNGKPGWKTW